MTTADIGIIMGSDSDLPVMRAAAEVCEEFEVSAEVTIVSAHRTPKRLYEYAEGAVDRGLKVIIAGAGGAAHLPGMVAAITPLPVIGVPVETGTLSGIDSLLSIVQMPKGVPVATVAINNARNAGLLALRMIALTSPPLLKKLADFMMEQERVVIEKAGLLEREGWRRFIDSKR
jgi:phosphoribosylaminoimidazole carboxylase PurE protein